MVFKVLLGLCMLSLKSKYDHLCFTQALMLSVGLDRLKGLDFVGFHLVDDLE